MKRKDRFYKIKNKHDNELYLTLIKFPDGTCTYGYKENPLIFNDRGGMEGLKELARNNQGILVEMVKAKGHWVKK